MKILSIDQSTIKSGWAFFIDGEYHSHGLLDKHKIKNSTEKFQQMCLAIRDLVLSINPDIVVFEDVAMQINVSVIITLARLQGTIIQTCYLCGKPFYIIKPTEWRKLLNMVQGRKKKEELKKQSIKYASEYLKQSNVGEDESDAICINIAYQNLIKGDK